jgi:hypothetical protein
VTVTDSVRKFAGAAAQAFRFTPGELTVLIALSFIVSPALFLGVVFRTMSFSPPPVGTDFELESPQVDWASLWEWTTGWAMATLILLFVAMVLTRAGSPGSTPPALRRLTAPCHFAPWAWLVLFAAMTAIMSVMPARNSAVPAVREDLLLRPPFVDVLSPYGQLALLGALALALVSPVVVTGDVLWRIARRERIQAWAPTLALYLAGLALMGALILGNSFGLWLKFFEWLLN